MTNEQNTKAADYASALAPLFSEAKAWRTMVTRQTKATESRTVTMVQALREAEDAGAIYDGRAKDAKERKGAGAITKGDLAAKAGVTGGMVTRWQTLAQALRIGVKPGDGVWQGLAQGNRPAVSESRVRDMVTKATSPADITTGLAALGYDPANPGHKVQGANAKAPRKATTGKDAEEATDTPIAPFQAAKDALKAFHVAVKSPTVGPEEWEALEGILTGILTSERKRRGLDPSTRRKSKATTATPADMPATKAS